MNQSPMTIQLPREGDRVRLGQHGDPNRWWNVRAADDRFAVATQQAPFRPAGIQQYTILDFHRQVRGPVNLVGGGYGDGTYNEAECRRLLAHLQSGVLEVTYRNPAPLEVLEVEPRKALR